MRSDTKSQYREIERLDDRDMVASTVHVARSYLETNPKQWIAWIYYAGSLAAMAKYSEALIALRRAARFCPQKFRQLVYSRFGELHRKRGAFRVAERWHRRAVELAPSDATYHIFLGALLAVSGRLQEAEVVHRRATKCKEGCIDEAFLNLGLVLRALERYAEARKCFRRALAIDPKYRVAQQALVDIEFVIERSRNEHRRSGANIRKRA